MEAPDEDVPVTPPSSPTGIPSWVWLPILTLFMLFVIWLSLRNFLQLLPLRMQYALRDFTDRAGYRGRIRLNDDAASTHYDGYTDFGDGDGDDASQSHSGFRYGNGRTGRVIHLDGVSSDEEEDDDDELPLASSLDRRNKRRRDSQRSSFSIRGRGHKFSRIAQLLTGKGKQQHHHHHPSSRLKEPDEEDPILDLGHTHRNTSYLQPDSNRNRERSDSSASSASNMFRTKSNEEDAPPLANNFDLSFQSPSQKATTTPTKSEANLSPTFERTAAAIAFRSQNPTRSPRSPMLSRTPSLNAIQEEPSSPRHPQAKPMDASSGLQLSDAEDVRTPRPADGFPSVANADTGERQRSASISSSIRSSEDGTTPDWASAVTSRSQSRTFKSEGTGPL